MAESFDYVGFSKDFEAINGRPPTFEELEDAQTLVGRYVNLNEGRDHLDELVDIFNNLPDQEMTRVERIKYRLKKVCSSLVRAIIKSALLIFQTPLYLTIFFFNLIKSTIGVLIIWFVSKLMIAFGLSMIVGYIYNEDLTKVPKIISSFGEFVLGSNYNFLSGSGGEPNFFPHPTFDAWIIGIAIVFFALVATFSKVEEI